MRSDDPSRLAGASRILFREDLVGLAWDVSVVTAAFEGAGEANLMICDESGRPDLRGPRLAMAEEAIRGLVRTIEKRVGVNAWVIGWGEGPGLLASRKRAPLPARALSARIANATLEERCRVLEALALESSEARPWDDLPEDSWALGAVAMTFASEEVARAFRILRERTGDRAEFWAAEDSLAVRISLKDEVVSFNSHHPVIQEALAHRCERLGIDLS